MKRSELHQLLWTEPVVTVAARIGLSDRGLAKICQRHQIPLPPRGYWAKVKGGQYPARSPLPRPDREYEIDLSGKPTAVANEIDGKTKPIASELMGMFFKQPEASAPIQSEATDSTLNEVEGESHGSRFERVVVSVDSGLPDANPTAFDAYEALDNECERVMSAGMEYQKRQAAKLFLNAMVSKAPALDANTAQTLLKWACVVQERLDRKDPLNAAMQSIRQTANCQTKPLWWTA